MSRKHLDQLGQPVHIVSTLSEKMISCDTLVCVTEDVEKYFFNCAYKVSIKKEMIVLCKLKNYSLNLIESLSY